LDSETKVQLSVTDLEGVNVKQELNKRVFQAPVEGIIRVV